MAKPPALGTLQPIDARQMRAVNRAVVLDYVRLSGPAGRSEISEALGLSLPTVVRLVNGLVDEGLLRESAPAALAGGRPIGRVEYNAGAHAVIGVDLGGTKMYGALATIGGEILAEATRAQHSSSGDDAFEILAGLIASLIAVPRGPERRILGIAAGAPGVTYYPSGVVEWAPSLEWTGFPLRDRLEARFRLPVSVDNDVNLMALGENWFGAGRGVSNMVLIAIGTGVGAGLIVNGMLCRGHHQGAGEIGYMVPGVSALGSKRDGFGALESIISGTGVAERGSAMRNHSEQALLRGMTAEDVFAAAREGATWAEAVVEETADYLSLAIANVATLLDPELIVLGGGVSSSLEPVLPSVEARICGVVQHLPRIVVSQLGSKAAVMGAIALMMHTATDYLVVRRPS
jgi:glucokinase-like ROK family protein